MRTWSQLLQGGQLLWENLRLQRSFLCAKLWTAGWKMQTKSWTYTEQYRALGDKTYASFVLSFVLCSSRQPNLEVCSLFSLVPPSSSSFQIPLTSSTCPFQTRKCRCVVLQLLEQTGGSVSPGELSLFHTHKPQALLIPMFYPWVNQGKERKWPPQEPQTPTGPGSHVKLQKVQ